MFLWCRVRCFRSSTARNPPRGGRNFYGKVVYQGAWNYDKPVHGPFEVPPMPEGRANNEGRETKERRSFSDSDGAPVSASGDDFTPAGPLMNLAAGADDRSRIRVAHEGADRPWVEAFIP